MATGGLTTPCPSSEHLAQIAAANCLEGGGILAVHRDGTVWRYSLVPSPNLRQPMVMAWRKLPWTNVADIARTGQLVFFDGATGFGASPNNAALRRDKMSGFKRTGGTACSTDVFFVGHNGTLWFLDPTESRFTPKQTPASEMADVDVSQGKVWLVGKNGTVWTSYWGPWPGRAPGLQWQWLEARQFERNRDASGFESIAAYNSIGALAVGWNGTLWLYRQDPSESHP